MSLATRCTACGTVFRVVEDQLKVSQGWVRCGRCNEVFDAQTHLVEVPPRPFPAEPAPAPEPPAAERPAKAPASNPLPPLAEAPEGTEAAASAMDAEPLSPGPPDLEAPDEVPAESTIVQANDIQAEAATATDSPSDITAADPADALPPGAPAQELPIQADLREGTLAAQPSFMRQAERAARWHSKGVRAGLALAALALAALLAAQVAVSERDWMAARWPQSRPLLEQLCQPIGCQVQALRRVDQINVASSGLTRIEGSPLYRFSMVLLNRSELPLMMPAIDLALTDAQGQVIARRVLSASELGVEAAAVKPGIELPLQAMLSTGSRRVAGYTIELFYP